MKRRVAAVCLLVLLAGVPVGAQGRHSVKIGVLKLTLSDGSWKAEFMGVSGSAFHDTDSGACR